MRKKMKAWAGGLLALCMAIGLCGVPVQAEGEDKLFETFPPSDYYDRLWVDDTVTFTGLEACVGDGTVSFTIISGEGIKEEDRGAGFATLHVGLKFTKSGKAVVKVKITDPGTGASAERTLSFTVSPRPADKPVTAKVAFSKKTIKVGDKNPWHCYSYSPDAEPILPIFFENANYGDQGYDTVECNIRFDGTSDFLICPLHMSEIDEVDINRKKYLYGSTQWGYTCVYKPGTITLQPTYKNKPLNSSSTLTVEEPVITTNAPASVKTGSSLQLTTTLTNLSDLVKNLKASEYAEIRKLAQDANYLAYIDCLPVREEFPQYIAYQPKVEIIAGKDIVKQSKQDYSHTLSTSETLTFTKTGTVQLKVTYSQIVTAPEMRNGKTYSPEKTITIQVTEDGKPAQPPKGTTTPAGTAAPRPAPGSSSAPSGSAPGSTPSGETTSPSGEPTLPPVEEQPVVITDEETGIQLGAAEGVVPPDTALVVKPSDFVLTDAAGKFTAFDISLESGGAKIQPNGRVQVSIPVPAGYDKERLTIYHIADDGTKTELPCAVAGDAVTFETDHFSLYVLAEKAAVQAADGAPQPDGNTSKPGGSPVVWIVLAVVLLAAAGGGFALWFFKFRKKPDAGA